MANKQLTAKVRLNSKDAEQKLKNIAKAIDKINRAAGKQSNVFNQVNSALGKTVKTSEKIRSKTDQNTQSTKRWSNAVGDVNKKLNSSSKSVSLIGSKLRGLADQYLGVMGLGAVVRTSDMITSAENKLNYVHGGDKNLTQDAMDKMYASSQKVRMGYGDMMSNVSKSMALAGDAFNNNTDIAIRFQEVMAEAYAVGGASAQEMSSSMYQMIQALGSGTLAGDELRSVREGAPLAYKEIEKFAQKTLNATESLKDLGSQGKITSDIVVAAVLDAGEAMDDAFAQTDVRFDQVWTQIKNAAIRAFKPISEILRDKLNEVVKSGLIQKIETAFANIAKAIMIAFTVMHIALRWIVDNWDWLKYIVITALIVIGALFAKTAATAIWSAIQIGAKWLWANKLLIIIAITITLLILVWNKFRDGTINACQAITLALLIVGLALLVIGLIVGSQALMIIGFILLIATCIFTILEYILGVIYAAVSVIWNTIVTLVIAIIKNAILPITTAWDNFANFFGNLFNDPIAAIIRCFENLADNVLSILETIANGIDAIFGSNLASAVQGWRSGLSSYADKLVDKYGNGTYEEKSNVTDKVDEILNSVQTKLLWSTSDAWNTGKDHGTKVKDWINEFGSKFQNQDEKGNLLDKIGEMLGLDFSGLTFPTEGVDVSSYDPSKALNNIDDNTGKMADSMELTSEDVEYLRKIAAMEWKKEYTVADIKVDMSNYNTISGDSDLDGIVTKLSEKLYEELNEVADGVYAY